MIELTRKIKKNNDEKVERFESCEKLENRLSGISSAYYNIHDYKITSNDFFDLTSYFVENYNEGYYKIDNIEKSITIHKLPVGAKRRKFFSKKRKESQNIIEKTVKRLSRKYDIIYEKGLGIIELDYYGSMLSVVSFEINEKTFVLENVSINGIKVEEMKEVINITNKITQHLNKLTGKIIK